MICKSKELTGLKDLACPKDLACLKGLTYLKDIACDAALAAGEIIKKAKGKINVNTDIETKDSGSTIASQVVTKVDLEAQNAILSILKPTLKQWNIALLSEELDDDGSRFQKDYFWAIDPLDGTLPFIEENDGYAVSIALISKTGVPHLGVVFDPVTNTLYDAIKDNGAFSNGKRIYIPDIQNTYIQNNSQFHLIVDRSLKLLLESSSLREKLTYRLSKRGLFLTEDLSLSGAVLNACKVMENPQSCYFKPPKKEDGGGCLWDFGATACIFTEAGGIVTDCAGQPLDLNSSQSLYLNRRGVLFATTPELSELCIDSLRAYSI